MILKCFTVTQELGGILGCDSYIDSSDKRITNFFLSVLKELWVTGASVNALFSSHQKLDEKNKYLIETMLIYSIFKY